MYNLVKGAVLMVVLAGSALPAVAQNVEFTLVNNSSQSLHYMYAAPSKTTDWGDDLLGETGTLESGEQGIVFIGDGSDQCLYDLRFETGEGSELDAYEVDICELGSYTLTD
jgi:hypothetical protein